MNMDANCERPRHCGARGTASRSPRLQWLSHRRGCNAVHRACLTPREDTSAALRENTFTANGSMMQRPRNPSHLYSTAQPSPDGGGPRVASIGSGNRSGRSEDMCADSVPAPGPASRPPSDPFHLHLRCVCRALEPPEPGDDARGGHGGRSATCCPPPFSRTVRRLGRQQQPVPQCHHPARASHPLELARLVVMLRHARMLRPIDTEFLPRRG